MSPHGHNFGEREGRGEGHSRVKAVGSFRDAITEDKTPQGLLFYG